MTKYCPLFLLIILSLISACKPDQTVAVETEETGFSVDQHYILKNETPFIVRGVVYVPGYPGYLPWEIESSASLPDPLKQSIYTDLSNIKAMGANTVRFWGAPQYCYEALREIGGLHFLQTIWISGDQADFHNIFFKRDTKEYIKQVIDRVYAAFEDNDPPIIAWLIGNELSEAGIRSTDSRHPDLNHFSGNYITTDSSRTASEVFIAEMADYARTYEMETYGNQTLLSYSNEIRTYDLIDIPFLDFVSHNAYSYAVPYYRPGTAAGSHTGTVFQGWIEEVKAKHPDIPLLITETGLSVSPNAYHVGPPNYGYGGNTEAEQETGLLQNLNDINTTALPLAGVTIHEYLDAWWKFSLEDSYSQDPNDIEEWFGIVKLIPTGNWYTTEFRPSYQALKETWAPSTN